MGDYHVVLSSFSSSLSKIISPLNKSWPASKYELARHMARQHAPMYELGGNLVVTTNFLHHMAISANLIQSQNSLSETVILTSPGNQSWINSSPKNPNLGSPSPKNQLPHFIVPKISSLCIIVPFLGYMVHFILNN